MVFDPYQQGMVISTPPINSTSDQNTITMNNTLANAKITAPFTLPNSTPKKPFPTSPSSSTTSSFKTSSTTSTANQTGPLDPAPNTSQPRQPSRRVSAATDGYIARVGFDTLGGSDTAEYAFTLQSKTDNWKRTRTSRTFLVGTDLNDYSAHALHWVMENMVEDGDEVVALRVMPVELRDSLSKTGIPSFQGQEKAARSEATKIMNSIREKNTDKEISIVVEYMVGNVRDTIQHMIRLYEPDMLVVGTRGRSSVKGFLLGSVSRYCLHHSTVPVIVVRPARKLNKSKNKAKGIFRRRSSVLIDDNQGYHPHPTQPIHMSTSDFDLRSNSSASSNSNLSSLSGSSNTLSTPGIALFPSATISGGERFPSNRLRTSSGLFSSGSPASSVSSITLPPINQSSRRSPAPPPPEGVIKMKKSLTTDGTGKGSKSFGKSSGGFLSGSLLLGPLIGGSKDKDKEGGGSSGGGIGGFLKGKKRHSHGG